LNLFLAKSDYLCKIALLFIDLHNQAVSVRSVPMRDLLVLLVHFLTTLARLLGPGGMRAVNAEALVVKHQLVILNRSRRRAPNLTTADRIAMGLCKLFMNPRRIRKVAAALKPAT